MRQSPPLVAWVKKWLEKPVYFILSNVFYALAIQLFYFPNDIAAGGMAGIATVLTQLIPVSLGVLVFLMNIPFAIWAVFVFGWAYSLKTVLALAVYGVFVDALSSLPPLTDNLLVAALFGGVLSALGAVCIIKAGTSAGGTDLIAKLLRNYFPHLSLGTFFLIINGLSVLFAMVVFGSIELGLIAIIAVYVTSYVTDKILTGVERACLCYVITQEEPSEISASISQKLNRSVTLQKGVGMYHKTDRNILMVVVKPREIILLKRVATEYDPNSFVVIAHASEVLGGGFSNELL